MPRPKITYFDFPGGRGEDCRIALHIAGVDFDDNRIKGSTWAEHKATTPYGELPVFEIPGKGELAQSNVILRFIGTHHDLHPKDDWRAAQHEAVMEACESLRTALAPSLRMKDEDEKKAAREKLVAGYIPTWAANIEKQLGEGPFLDGDQLNVADLKLWSVVRWLNSGKVDHISADVFSNNEALTAHFNAVNEHEGVKSWYAK